MIRSLLAAITLVALGVAPIAGEVVRVEVDSREDVLGGQPFGAAGAYEKITGRIYFAFDPDNPMNARIVDIGLAPRNAAGRVEAWANFMVLRPKNRQPGTVAVLEVSNRGGKASLRYFNGGARAFDPTSEEDFGDGLLMRLGFTIIWVGWQHDVPLREGRLRLSVPLATNDGAPIEGLVRADWVVEQTTRVLRIGHRDHVAYPVADTLSPDNVLTVRDGRERRRKVIPRTDWGFTTDVDELGVEHLAISADSGFVAGMIYELVYRAVDPRVVGLGLAAVRDMMSYAKYDSTSLFPAEYGIGVGISQTGRFLRHFVYQGFNTDEQERKVFDGLIVHTAGAGRGSFNHRFAQPSRDGHRYSAFFYPTDIFPFSSRTQGDLESGARDGLFAHAHDRTHVPKIFFTNTGYEYWGRAASLIHTTVDGRNDIRLYRQERIYHLASGQHFVGPFPPPEERALPNSTAYRGNPLNFLLTMRALMVRMVEWVRDGVSPPPSLYPTFGAGTLVSIKDVDFPKIRGVRLPKVIHEAYRVDYGPRWSEGIIDKQPPELGDAFPSFVPQVDSFGNERGGVKSVEILVPLATYAPWNLRTGLPGRTSELTNFRGTYIPFSKTDQERKDNGDPRPSIESLYASREEYLERVTEATGYLVDEGFLLPEDAPAAKARAALYWDWIFEN